jgi:hypothetical protein
MISLSFAALRTERTGVPFGKLRVNIFSKLWVNRDAAFCTTAKTERRNKRIIVAMLPGSIEKLCFGL